MYTAAHIISSAARQGSDLHLCQRMNGWTTGGLDPIPKKTEVQHNTLVINVNADSLHPLASFTRLMYALHVISLRGQDRSSTFQESFIV